MIYYDFSSVLKCSSYYDHAPPLLPLPQSPPCCLAQKCAPDSADTALRGLHKEQAAVDLMDVWSHLDVLTIGLFPHVAGWNHSEPISVNV